MAIPEQGTFEYVAVVPDRVGTVFSCQARLLGLEVKHFARLVGPSPWLQVEDAGPTPNPSESNPATERSRLRLTAADRRQATIAEASFILNRGVISALHPGDLLFMVRTDTGGIGISAIRSNQLIFAAGAIAEVPLGCNFNARIPWDLIREAEAVFRRREIPYEEPTQGRQRKVRKWQRFRLSEYPIEVRASGEQHFLYRGSFALGSFEVWVRHGYYFVRRPPRWVPPEIPPPPLGGVFPPGDAECLSVVQKGACPIVDADAAALFLDSGNLEMVRWPND